MICKQCGKEIPDGSKFCLECGAPVEVEEPAEEVAEAEETPAVDAPCEETEEVPAKAEKKTCKMRFFAPNILSGLILSGLSFIAGIVLFSICLANAFAKSYGIDFLVILPALAGLILGVYNCHAAAKAENKTEKIVSFVCVVVAAFVLLFAFISCCILNA